MKKLFFLPLATLLLLMAFSASGTAFASNSSNMLGKQTQIATNEQNIVGQHIGVHPNCSPSLSADSAAGANPGVSLGIHVAWSCSGSTSTFIKAFWGDGTSGQASGFSFDGSGIFFHTWQNPGNFTVRWELWTINFNGSFHVATAFTPVFIN